MNILNAIGNQEYTMTKGNLIINDYFFHPYLLAIKMLS